AAPAAGEDSGSVKSVSSTMPMDESQRQGALVIQHRRRRWWKLLRSLDSSIELSQPKHVEFVLELKGLSRQEALVIKACTSDSRNFESACATLVEHYSGVHLRAGRTLLGGPNEDHRRSGKGPRQGSIGERYSRGKGKVFVRKAYIAEDEALAFPEEEGFGDDDNQDIYQETSYPALGDEHGYELRRVCGHVSQEKREHVYTMDPAVMRGTFADEVPQEFNKERKAAAKRVLEATEQAITTVMDQSPGLIKGLKNCTFAVEAVVDPLHGGPPSGDASSSTPAD
ncbi:unnamed protein product, partial [Symbiodinium sp. KB8]